MRLGVGLVGSLRWERLLKRRLTILTEGSPNFLFLIHFDLLLPPPPLVVLFLRSHFSHLSTSVLHLQKKTFSSARDSGGGGSPRASLLDFGRKAFIFPPAAAVMFLQICSAQESHSGVPICSRYVLFHYLVQGSRLLDEES